MQPATHDITSMPLYAVRYALHFTSTYIPSLLIQYYCKCDVLQEKITYVGKMNFEFSTKFGSERLYRHVPEEYKTYCSIEPEKQAYKVQILKNVLLRKLRLKFLEDIKTKNNSYLSTVYTNYLKFGCEVSEVCIY